MKQHLTNLTADNKDNIYGQIMDELWDKCNDGFALQELNEFEKPLIISQIIEDSINGGGINTYFFNNADKYTTAGLDAFQKLGMTEVYEIFKQAVDAFPAAEIPQDLEACRQIMESLPEENPADETWTTLTDAFYNLDPNYFMDKKLEYMLKHVDSH
ncbi:DUF4375 domain-containing protein [uncultured Fluviicola sp.]|uniref:DMP19 family protein n=1 Tax=uncultured Fluviicola sp. TaxID=463303 RepID=UPI0025F50F17|nr:DUF4375 domain-containing protein [uncultured Fluviicola sp.]